MVPFGVGAGTVVCGSVRSGAAVLIACRIPDSVRLTIGAIVLGMKRMWYSFVTSGSPSVVRVADVIRIEEQALKTAGKKGREIYMMFVHRGESAGEIARHLDLSERTVENHIFRTRTKVRIALRQAL